MITIRLSKKNKTIKIVNRRDTLRLQRPEKTINVVNHKENLRLSHTGKTGPQGETGAQGETGVSTFVRIHHGSNPSIARSLAQFVEWVGSVAPLNATTQDTWIDTA